MGLFDYVIVEDKRFVCSEGHLLGDDSNQPWFGYAGFQTKDFDCVMGTVEIRSGRVSFGEGPLGLPHTGVYHGTFTTYATCPHCPAFVQMPTANLVATWVEFEVECAGNVVFTVRRTSPTTAEFLANEAKQPWMAQCEGPMPFADAVKRHQDVAFGRTKP